MATVWLETTISEALKVLFRTHHIIVVSFSGRLLFWHRHQDDNAAETVTWQGILNLWDCSTTANLDTLFFRRGLSCEWRFFSNCCCFRPDAPSRWIMIVRTSRNMLAFLVKKALLKRQLLVKKRLLKGQATTDSADIDFLRRSKLVVIASLVFNNHQPTTMMRILYLLDFTALLQPCLPKPWHMPKHWPRHDIRPPFARESLPKGGVASCVVHRACNPTKPSNYAYSIIILGRRDAKLKWML